MDSLPAEILGLILHWNVRMCRCEKNTVLPLRRVCKAFDIALKPYIFKTVQLEFSRFLRNEPKPRIEDLATVGGACEALYLDMMVVRDDEEITRLSNVFQGLIPKVPEMVPLLNSLRRYCMNETTWDETDFKRVLEDVLSVTPNLKRLKLNLPFQVVGQQARTATLLLATTMAALQVRPEDAKVLDTLVLDHVSDTTMVDICHNPIDLGHAINAFAGLKHLVLSIKRQEQRIQRQQSFTQYLWFLIRKAIKLDSLCLIGWNVKRDINTRTHHHGVSLNIWNMRCLPYHRDLMHPQLEHLRYLELKRVDINPCHFLEIMRETKGTLKELYLNEVYLKVHSAADGDNTSLWIGRSDLSRPKKGHWVAEDLRDMEGLRLDVLRVTGLGYDDFQPDETNPGYDLKDPSPHSKSFDQRFVEAVLGVIDVVMEETPGSSSRSSSTESLTLPPITRILSDYSTSVSTRMPAIAEGLAGSSRENTPPFSQHINLPPLSKQLFLKQREYDAETFQRHHNTTSHFKRCIDGYFFNHNEQALKELQNIITVADRGMTLLSEEIDRTRYAGVLRAADGAVVDQPAVAPLPFTIPPPPPPPPPPLGENHG